MCYVVTARPLNYAKGCYLSFRAAMELGASENVVDVVAHFIVKHHQLVLVVALETNIHMVMALVLKLVDLPKHVMKLFKGTELVSVICWP